MHTNIRIVDQHPGLRDIELLGNTNDVAGIKIQRLLHGFLHAFQFRLFEYVEILGNQIRLVLQHFQVLQKLNLLGTNGVADIGSEKRFGEQRLNFVLFNSHFQSSLDPVGHVTFMHMAHKIKANSEISCQRLRVSSAT